MAAGTLARRRNHKAKAFNATQITGVNSDGICDSSCPSTSELDVFATITLAQAKNIASARHAIPAK